MGVGTEVGTKKMIDGSSSMCRWQFLCLGGFLRCRSHSRKNPICCSNLCERGLRAEMKLSPHISWFVNRYLSKCFIKTGLRWAFLKLTRAQALRPDGANAPWCSGNGRKWNFYLNDDWGCGGLLARKVWNAHRYKVKHHMTFKKFAGQMVASYWIKRKVWLKVSSVHHFFTFTCMKDEPGPPRPSGTADKSKNADGR